MPSRATDAVAAVTALPDLLVANLRLVFLGINPSVYSAERGHYFARPANRFWPCFSASTISLPARAALGVERLRPEHDRALLAHGIGFTDVVKRPTVGAAEVPAAEFAANVPHLLVKLASFAPRVACFQGVTGYRPIHRALAGDTPIALGLQPLRVGATRIFVVPNPSGANAHVTRAEQTAWYDRLALACAAAVNGGGGASA